MGSHTFAAFALLGLLVGAAACKGSAECSKYDFNGAIHQKWYECSDGKSYTLDCKYADKTYDCTCQIDGKPGKKVSWKSSDDPFKGADESKSPGIAASQCGWGEVSYKKK